DLDLVVTTGGLGPTADDLTVATVADFCGLPTDTDAALQRRIEEIVREWRRLAPGESLSTALEAGIAKQALVPSGATPIGPTGTAPGFAVPPDDRHPAVLILPGPPG